MEAEKYPLSRIPRCLSCWYYDPEHRHCDKTGRVAHAGYDAMQPCQCKHFREMFDMADELSAPARAEWKMKTELYRRNKAILDRIQ